MGTQILFSPVLPKTLFQAFQDQVPGGCTLSVASQGTPEFDAAVAEAEIFVGIPRLPLNEAFFATAPKLRLVQLITAGFENVDLAAAAQAKVTVCNNGGANSLVVAEHAMTLILAALKRIVPYHRNVEAGKWRIGTVADQPIQEADGKTLGIVGLGKIGQKVAEFARVFNMNLVYHDARRIPEADEARLAVRYLPFAELLAQSDVVSIHVPLTPETRDLFGSAQFKQMKRSALLVNTSRGGVINEKDLHEALVGKIIAGAALDVLAAEPPPSSNALLKLDNILITPHVSASPLETWRKMFRAAADNIRRSIEGEPLLWEVRSF